MTFIRIIIVYKTTFIQAIAICTHDSIIQHSVILYAYVTITYIHGVVTCPLFSFPLLPLLFSLSLPFVPLFHLLGALQLWQESSSLFSGCLWTDPICPTLHPIVPPFPISQNPNCPTPNNDNIGTAPLWLCGTVTNIQGLLAIGASLTLKSRTMRATKINPLVTNGYYSTRQFWDDLSSIGSCLCTVKNN
jgi:hypothetical protein